VGTDQAKEETVAAVRRTPLAARLKATYKSVDDMDAFVGMVSEKHVAGSELGELQMAMWKKQFTALRDGDRFFYLNDPGLSSIRKRFSVDFRASLADIIARNTDIPRGELADKVFLVEEENDKNAKDNDKNAKDNDKNAKDNAQNVDDLIRQFDANNRNDTNDPGPADREDPATMPAASKPARRRRRWVT
jgi:hypothetical protein